MALDGAFLRMIKNEIEKKAVNGRIDKIHQPSKEEIIITLRGLNGSYKLLINAGANSPRIHFTDKPPENPKTPPMFCMLLRKYLNNGKLISVKQFQLDRIIFLDFESKNDFGDIETYTICVEIMGRHSNIIFLNKDGKIIDAVKRVNEEMSGFRRVLPGMDYSYPPVQDKLDLTEKNSETILEKLQTVKNTELSKALMNVLQGISPLLAREIAHYTTRGAEVYKDDLSGEQKERLKFCLDRTADALRENIHEFTMLLEDGKPKEFSFVNINQYGTYMASRKYGSAGEMLDAFYSERDRIDRLKQRSHGLLKMLLNSMERISRKLETQKQELKQSAERDMYKNYADLINSNLYRIEKGMDKIKLENFYDGNNIIEIKLDPLQTPVQNAQKYYSEYKKAVTAEKMLTGIIEQGEKEILYIDSVFDAVMRTSTEAEINEIREELTEQGYLKTKKINKNKTSKPLPPLRYTSADGFTILCGRNNKQNDKLTLKEAKPFDIWCHTQNIPGSHVIIISGGEKIPDNTIEEACIIAAYNSKARESALVPVDYTFAKNVKKPNGAKPGMVIFTDNKTAFVTPQNKEKE